MRQAVKAVNCPAPAKLNLFLHVTGRRADGYHLLQTAFRLLDWGDRLSLSIREDGVIRRVTDVPGIDAQQDLTVRAAQLLQQQYACRLGVDIRLEKHLPAGGGLGGGSSDAATTLIGLNRLWRLGASRRELAVLGLRLGADVPVFIFGQDAFAEGVGEQLQPIFLPQCWYVVVFPAVHVPTAEIFTADDLTRNHKPIRITDFAMDVTGNDLQPVACRRYPAVQEALDWLGQYAPARMTGSGSCIFAGFASEQQAARVVQAVPEPWQAWKARSLEHHPLYDWLNQPETGALRN